MVGIGHEKDRAGARPTVYRPRRPERTPFYRLVMDHFGRFARLHEELFESTDGPLRAVVHQVVGQYLDCDLLAPRHPAPLRVQDHQQDLQRTVLGQEDARPGIVVALRPGRLRL